MANLTKQQFIDTLVPHVLKARKEGSPLFPSVRLAQNLLETGGVLHPWNNLGGIKAGTGKKNAYWHGRTVAKGTWEVEGGATVNTSALFRAYDSLYDFYKDQDLLLQLPRYERVRTAATPSEQAGALRQCGYATDPQYDAKLISLLRTYKLTSYDEQPPNRTDKTIPIFINQREAAEGLLMENQTWVPARAVGELMEIRVNWNGKAVSAAGKVLPTRLIGNTGYVPIRELAAVRSGAKLRWDQEHNRVDLTLQKDGNS